MLISLKIAALQVLNDSPIRVQVAVAKLVSAMAELDSVVREEFARENVTRPLVSLLAMDTVLDDPKLQSGKATSIHSIVQINKELTGKSSNSSVNSHSTLTTNVSFTSSHHHSDGSGRGGHFRKDKDVESPEVKLKLKVVCAEALWKLCKDTKSMNS